MALSDKLIGKLACPRCRGSLEYSAGDDRLLCNSCRIKFQVMDDIPVLLLDETEKLN